MFANCRKTFGLLHFSPFCSISPQTLYLLLTGGSVEIVKLGLIWGLIVHCDVFILVCCAFCMLGNVHSMFLEVLDTNLVKVQGGGGYFFWRRLS